MQKTNIGPRGKQHVKEQMERFKSGKLLRTSSGQKLNFEDPEDRLQAMAIFYNEAERGEERGFAKRTYRGSKRMRPNKSNK